MDSWINYQSLHRNELGFWTSETGITITANPEKWVRRRDLKGHRLMVSTLTAKPYTTDMVFSPMNGFNLSGMFPQVNSKFFL